MKPNNQRHGRNGRWDSRSGNRRPHGRDSGAAKKRTYLSGDYSKDMKSLRIFGSIRNPQTRCDEYKDETPQFITYLTLALQNISDIVGQDISGFKNKGAVENALSSCGKLFNVASFLWMHRVDEPGRDYDRIKKGEFADWAREIVVALWKLRNMFVHPHELNSARVLVVSKDFYRFVEGELFSEAREHALGPGRKSEKVYKLRLFTPHDDLNSCYEFTRKGMIFLVCLALYRHDASEFIQQFPDLQLPPREWEMEKGYKRRMKEDELVALRKKGGSVKAILDAFTWYSMRASRTDIDVENKDYLNFANILLYLNKAPSASYNYLSLDKEAERLVQKASESQESDENKRFKYVLQERRKDRFLTLALAYLEDFHKLDCIKFKRLDITVRPERSRYMFGPIPENEFGKPLSDANGMDRHYAIHGGMAQFEFVPKAHYGTIEIASLRGSLSEDEIMRLLFVMFDNDIRRGDPNRAVEAYLTAYHRILERMLNAKDAGVFSLDDPQFRADFKLVSGKGDEVLAKERFVEEMKPFFPENLTRYFVGDDLRPDVKELQKRLSRRFTALAARADDFLLKMDKLTDWRKLDKEAREMTGYPTCAIGELRFPPRTCKINDAQMIQWVLRYINLYLSREQKYRQLPRGMRHRGVRDFEFQSLHTDIGRFGSNPDGLWRTLEKRSDLNGEDGALEALKGREHELFSAEQDRCRGKRDKNGHPLRVGHTLTMLSTAAAELYSETCEAFKEMWCGDLSAEDRETLPSICPAYGVRAGLPLDRGSLVKTILGIDLKSWSMAYDYENGAPRETPRSLEDAENLIVTQVPMPNVFAARCVRPGEDGGRLKFNPAFRDFLPYEKGKMALRDYYDVSPLITAVKHHDKFGYTKRLPKEEAENNHDRANSMVECSGIAGVEIRTGESVVNEESFGKNPPREMVSFARGDVNQAIQAIQLAERQDKVLLACAKEYWDRYMGDETTSTSAKKDKKGKIQGFHLSEAADIWEFFDTPLIDTVGGVNVRMMPNDFARPAYGVVVTHIKELIEEGKVSPGSDGTYSFYDLWLALRDLQRRENSIRLELLPSCVKFNAFVDIPQELEDLPKDDPTKSDRILKHCNDRLRTIGVKGITAEEFKLLCNFEPRLRHPSRDGLELVKCNLKPIRDLYHRLGF